jgi:alpha-tubulin suppressor-like RCC1 family protein
VTCSFCQLQGSAYCWGFNSSGQHGDGTTNNSVKPVPVLGGLQFRAISAGHHTCGVTTKNRAYCWGENDSGEVGDGTTINRLTLALVRGGLRFRQVVVGSFHTCGLTTTNRIYCWGVQH